MVTLVFLLTFAKNFLVFQPAIIPYYCLLTIEIADIPAQLLSEKDLSYQPGDAKNAAWLEHRWFQEGWNDEEAVQLARRLKENNIRYIYPHLAPSGLTGELPPFSTRAANRFRKILKREHPGIQILPWVGGVQSGYRQMRPGTVNLESEEYRAVFARQCTRLTADLGFEGIHLNIEPVESGDPRLPQWLKFIKQSIGEKKVLSIAASKPSLLDGFNFSPLRSWDLDYFEEIGKNCDQMVIMSYDTGIPHPLIYSLYVLEKTAQILQRFAKLKLKCRVLLGIPTYDDAPAHSSRAENLKSALLGVRGALHRSNDSIGNFEGVALYAYWTTSDEEWLDFSSYWPQTDVPD